MPAQDARRRRGLAALLALASVAGTLLYRLLGGPLHLSGGLVLASAPLFAAFLLAAPGRSRQARAVRGAGLYVLGALASGALFIVTGSPLAGFFVSMGGLLTLLMAWPAILVAAMACGVGIAPCA